MGLPFKPFLYTLDQVSDLLSVPLNTLKSQYLSTKPGRWASVN